MAGIRESNEIKKIKSRLRNHIANSEGQKRKSLTEYKSMKKKDILNSLFSFIQNFDLLREKYLQVELENSFLKRRINLLEEQLSFYREYYLPKNRKSQKRVDSPRKQRRIYKYCNGCGETFCLDDSNSDDICDSCVIELSRE